MSAKEIKHRKVLRPEIVDILSELSDLELWCYKWANVDMVSKKFNEIRKKIVNLSD